MGRRKHFLFDLEGTLVDTSSIDRSYFKSAAGRSHVQTHIDDFTTALCDNRFETLLKLLHSEEDIKCSIVSNAPVGYVHAVLSKHGFPPSLSVYGSQKKPLTQRLQRVINDVGIPSRDCCIIGDSPHDILAAHALHMPSIAVDWGVFSREGLEKSEPGVLVDSYEALAREGIIPILEGGKLPYRPRDLSEFHFFGSLTYDPEIQVVSVGSYHPTYSREFDEFSKQILDVKSMRDVPWDSIASNTDHFKYFFNGSLRSGRNIGRLFCSMRNQALQKLLSLHLKGSVEIMASPNSLPTFCYTSDYLQQLAYNIHHADKSVQIARPRRVERVHPKSEAHNNSVRTSLNTHLETIAVPQKTHWRV